MGSSPQISTTTARRTWLALVAFVVSWMAPIAHEAFTEHVVCVEHGEIAHAGAAHGTEGLSPQVAVAEPSDLHDTHDAQGPALSAGSAAAEHDEHCQHVVLRDPRRPPVLASVLADVFADSSARPLVEPGARLFVARRLYRLAPKGSPPVC
mgnify:CR=1 FL=1